MNRFILFSNYPLQISSVLFASFLFFSCANQPKEQTEEKKTPATSIETFYLHAFNNDTVKLKLIDSNQHLSGTLEYLPFEKDGTIGTLYDLKFSGDTLFGMYKSEQEGIESIGEMAMLKVGKSFILTEDIWGSDNYSYDSSYTNGKFIDKSKISFKGDTLVEMKGH